MHSGYIYLWILQYQLQRSIFAIVNRYYMYNYLLTKRPCYTMLFHADLRNVLSSGVEEQNNSQSADHKMLSASEII